MEGKYNKFPNCWICNDHGLIIYSKRYHGIEYDFACRCKCRLGQSSSEKIKVVPDKLVEKLAEENFNRFKGVYPELVVELA
ncbi:MAG: hypothetical protein GX053_11970 [Tissierella sp.]|nr:hypothetical protein [Tissierella sp.]